MLCYVNIYHKNFLFGGLLKFIVLYCTVLYCTVLYCTVLYCTVLYCTVLYCTVLYQTDDLSYTDHNLPLRGKQPEAWVGLDDVSVPRHREGVTLQEGHQHGHHVHGGVVQVLQQDPMTSGHCLGQTARLPLKLTGNVRAPIRP